MFLLLTVFRPALGLERIWKEAVVAWFDMDPTIREFAWRGLRRTTITDILAEIRAECIPNTTRFISQFTRSAQSQKMHSKWRFLDLFVYHSASLAVSLCCDGWFRTWRLSNIHFHDFMATMGRYSTRTSMDVLSRLCWDRLKLIRRMRSTELHYVHFSSLGSVDFCSYIAVFSAHIEYIVLLFWEKRPQQPNTMKVFLVRVIKTSKQRSV
jgi:hypothetical protein